MPFPAGVQPRQDPGGTLRMNGEGGREIDRERERQRQRQRERDQTGDVQPSLADLYFLP